MCHGVMEPLQRNTALEPFQHILDEVAKKTSKVAHLACHIAGKHCSDNLE